MKRCNSSLLRACGAFTVLIFCSTSLFAQRTSEASIRTLIVRMVTPKYPSASVAKGSQGVAVAQFLVNKGIPERIEILEAPDKEIAATVKAAVAQWVFKPITTRAGKPIWSKLTFYFDIKDGRGLVLNPTERADKK